MSKVAWILGVALALCVGVARAEGEAQKSEVRRGCLSIHSRAFCLTLEANVGIGMRDATPSDESQARESGKQGGGLWYVGAAAGSGTKVFRQAKGFSAGGEVGLFLLGALLSSGGDPDMIGRNLIFGWMPTDLAADKTEAAAKAKALVLQATKAAFAGSTFTEEAMEAAGGAVRYRVSGGVCEGHECLLVPVLRKANSAEPMGTRATLTTVPRFTGSKAEAYRFSSRHGALYPMTLLVDGEVQTHTYLQELSKHLPEWLYIAASPETKLADGTVFNAGHPAPIVYHAGEPLYFRFPEVGTVREAVASR